jgi:hypothetical protein
MQDYGIGWGLLLPPAGQRLQSRDQNQSNPKRSPIHDRIFPSCEKSYCASANPCFENIRFAILSRWSRLSQALRHFRDGAGFSSLRPCFVIACLLG